MTTRSKKNWVLMLQPKNGSEKTIKLEITPIKAQRVLDMIQRELSKKEIKQSHRYTSISLEPFFVDAVVEDPQTKKVPSF